MSESSIDELSLKSIKQFDRYHAKFIFFLRFSLNQDFLFSGGRDKKLRIMDLESLSPIREFSFVDTVFYGIEVHCNSKSRLYVSGKSNTITRKFELAGELREKLTRKRAGNNRKFGPGEATGRPGKATAQQTRSNFGTGKQTKNI